MLVLSRNMLPVVVNLVATAACIAAPPKDSQLLRFVPVGAEIVSGIADPGRRLTTGRLLAGTHANNVDFDDCRALIGIDENLSVDEVVQVAASVDGDLNDHLLLLAGQFNQNIIYRAALKNGATQSDYDGFSLLMIPPFQRDGHRATEGRWFVIVSDRFLLFGNSTIAAASLDRYAHNEGIDRSLANRIAELPSDVNSWSVLYVPPGRLSSHLSLYLISILSHKALEGVDELALGVHYGSRDRVDFVLNRREARDSFERLLSQGQSSLAGRASPKDFRISKGSIDQNCIRGSFTVRANEFDRWLASAAWKMGQIDR